MEFVVPFVLENKEMYVWIFFDTYDRIHKYRNDGTEEKVRLEYRNILMEMHYPIEYLECIKFKIDSHQNVAENYGGDYRKRIS